MSDDTPRRILDPAVAERTVDGQLLYRLEQRTVDALSELETATLVVSLRSLATTLEDDPLARPAIVLDDYDHAVTLQRAEPTHVA